MNEIERQHIERAARRTWRNNPKIREEHWDLDTYIEFRIRRARGAEQDTGPTCLSR